jgi:integrase
VLSRDEINRLERSAGNERDRLIVRVLADTGIGVAELASLTVNDILERDRTDYLVVNGKGARQRVVPLTPELSKRLRRFVRSRSGGSSSDRLFLSQTGMRRGELLGLRWSNVDLEARRVTIVEQLSRRTQGVGRFGPPKTSASRRTIDLSTESVAALGLWREAQDEQRRAWAEVYQDEGLVFCHENGTSHDPRWMTNRFRKQVMKANVKRIRFHDLRHTSAVIGLRELGEAVDEVSKRLGHESTAFTLDIYGHLLPQRGKDVAVAFDRLVRERRDVAGPKTKVGSERDHTSSRIV